MKEEFSIEVSAEGRIRCIYQEGIEDFAKAMGGDITQIGRASHIEWEAGSWVVRSAKDAKFAIRWVVQTPNGRTLGVGDIGEIVTFDSKSDALYWEEQFFWALLRGGDKYGG